MILFDPATAQDVLDALRLLEGRLRGTGRSLSPGAAELLLVAQRSRRVSTGQPLSPLSGDVDDDAVSLGLLTYEETADRLRASVSTVKRLVREGQLAAVHVGRSARVRPVDLEAFIASLEPGDRPHLKEAS